MRRLLFVGALGAAFGLAAAAVSVAQGQPAASGAPAAADSSAASAATSGTGVPSVDWNIGDLLNNAPAKAVLAKDLPALLTYDGLDQIKGMSIRQISQFPQANIDAAKLTQIQTDLQATGSASGAPPAASAAPAAASSAAP